MGAAAIILLAIFAEVGLAQVGRRLMLPLLTHTGDDQHDDGHHIGQHIEQLLGIGAQRHAEQRHIVIQVAEHTEHKRADDRHPGLPQSKDDQRDGHPAAVTEGIVGPNTVGISIWAANLSSEEGYVRTLRNYQVSYTIGGLAFSSVPGLLADLTGSYLPTRLLAIALSLIVVIGVLGAYRSSSKQN